MMRRGLLSVSILLLFLLPISCGGGNSGGGSTDDPGNGGLEISGTPGASATVGQPYRFEPTATAPNGAALSFSIANQPSWTTFDTDNGVLAGTPTANDIGTFSDINISVTDGDTSDSLSPFSIVVTESPVTAEPFSFIVFGDLNGGGCERNDRVNRQIQSIAANEADAAFYISTGDIIDGSWGGSGESVCFASDPALFNVNSECGSGTPNGNMAEILSPLKDRTPVQGLTSSFYMALGNHDDNWGSGWYPDPCGQGICDYLAPLTPGDFINRPFDEADFCKLNRSESSYPNDFYYSFAYENSYFIVLRQNNDSNGMLSCNNRPASYNTCEEYCADPSQFDDTARNVNCYNVAQFDWLRSELQSAAAQYQHIFVFAHAPLVTSSDNHDPTDGHEQIRAVLEQYDVDIYFNGHNHAYERTKPIKGDQPDDSGTVYITAGSGGATTDGVNGAWFTAASCNDFATYGESGYADKMTTYLKISVDGATISGEVFSLGVQGGAVDQFTIQGSPVTPGGDGVQNIGGCDIFPQDNMWNTPIDQMTLDPKSDTYITNIGAATTVHPDFGTVWNGTDIGIPYDIIPDNQPFVDVSFDYYEETDPLDISGQIKPYPLPDNPSIEGGSDHHVLLVRQDSCILYELFAVEKDAYGNWTAGSGAVWDLSQNQVRPEGATSADAAGLAILPGLVRYEEVFGDSQKGIAPGLNHALRITLGRVQSGYIRPASHSDGQAGHDPDAPPMGLRLRLKADFDMSSYDAPIQVIMNAMKKYGVVIADTGGDMFLSGVHDDRWDDDQLRQLKDLTASDFEAVYTGPVIPYP